MDRRFLFRVSLGFGMILALGSICFVYLLMRAGNSTIGVARVEPKEFDGDRG